MAHRTSDTAGAGDGAWRPDPYGRFALRWHDGADWTEHVADAAGEQRIDPLGRSTVVPFALPETATGPDRTGWPPPDPSARRG